MQTPEILTITHLTRRVKELLEGQLGDVWVRGEISNLRRQSSGHVYFTLKDAGSQIAAVLFRTDAARLKAPLREGAGIVAFGRITVYEPQGKYQIILRTIVEDGLGDLQRRFEETKKRLQQEGLFDSQRKQPLPQLPRTIGFVTSPTGAALRDFVSILRRRGWQGTLRVFPARVQGNEAAAEIAAWITIADQQKLCELLVVGRGGGSLEDLWPFNEEIVVRAIAAAQVPIISAVGHEIDFTLSDFAADKRAETPSAAAELISSTYIESADRLTRATRDLMRQTDLRVERQRNRVSMAAETLRRHHPKARFEMAWMRIDDIHNQLTESLLKSLRKRQDILTRWQHALAMRAPENRMKLLAERLHQLSSRLEAASPKSTLQRGFVILRDEQGKVVSDQALLAEEQCVEATFRDGAAALKRIHP